MGHIYIYIYSISFNDDGVSQISWLVGGFNQFFYFP